MTAIKINVSAVIFPHNSFLKAKNLCSLKLCKGGLSGNIVLTKLGSDVRDCCIKVVISVQAFYRGLIVPGTKKHQK